MKHKPRTITHAGYEWSEHATNRFSISSDQLVLPYILEAQGPWDVLKSPNGIMWSGRAWPAKRRKYRMCTSFEDAADMTINALRTAARALLLKQRSQHALATDLTLSMQHTIADFERVLTAIGAAHDIEDSAKP